MALQNYLYDIPFSTYVLSDLAALDGNDTWSWIGRTLIGYISADDCSSVIPLGSDLTLHNSSNSLSGCWSLNKLDLSVYIIGGGDDSYVEISGITHGAYDLYDTYLYFYDCRPFTDQYKLYEVNRHAVNGDICKFWFNSSLCCRIHPGTNRTISSVWFDANAKYTDNTLNHISNRGQLSSFVFPTPRSGGYIPCACISEKLSVYLSLNAEPS